MITYDFLPLKDSSSRTSYFFFFRLRARHLRQFLNGTPAQVPKEYRVESRARTFSNTQNVAIQKKIETKFCFDFCNWMCRDFLSSSFVRSCGILRIFDFLRGAALCAISIEIDD